MVGSLVNPIAEPTQNFAQAFQQGQLGRLNLRQNQAADALRTAELIGRAAVDADTPEKWAAGMATLGQLGVPDAGDYADKFASREQIIRATQSVADQLKARTASRFIGSLGGQDVGTGMLGTMPAGQGGGALGSLGAGAVPPVGAAAQTAPSQPPASGTLATLAQGIPAPAAVDNLMAGVPGAAAPASMYGGPVSSRSLVRPTPQPSGYDTLDSRLPQFARSFLPPNAQPALAGGSGAGTLSAGAGRDDLRGGVAMDGLRATTARSESGGRPGVVNAQGYSGTYQMGEAALADAGVYTDPTPKVQNDWTGTFHIPGHPEVHTQADYLQNGEAQDASFDAHVARLSAEMQQAGLDRYIGQTVGGVPITKNGLIMMAHLGGVGGTRAFLESDGRVNRADSNGTTIADYGLRGAGMGGGNARPATRDVQAPSPNGVPLSALGVLAADPSFAETAVDTGLKQFGAKGGYATALTADQAQALGFLPGTVVQRKPDGTLDVLQKPQEANVLTLTPAQSKELGFPAGSVVQKTADGKLTVVQKGEDTSGGPFQGTSLDAQDSNILLRTDPSAPEYAMAYQRQYMTPKIVQIPDPNNPGALMSATVIVTPPANIRPPAGQQGAQPAPQQQPAAPQAGAQPQQGAPVPQPAPQAPQQPGGVTMQPIPGTSKLPSQPLPAEVAARIGLANQFLDNDLAPIRQAIKDGAMNGIYERAQLAVGAGTPGTLYARIQTGIDALRRNLTGAGMNMSEVNEYVGRYLPTTTDGSDRMLNKLNGLEADLKAVRDAVLAGRNPIPELAGKSSDRPNTMPGQQDPTQPTKPPAAPKSKAEYDALPPGSLYIHPDDAPGSPPRKKQ